jgi:hypothetical protein
LGSTSTRRSSFGDACRSAEQSIVLMQPDFPEPVVPATSACGISARSVEIACPETSFPSHTASGEAPFGRPA